MSDTEHHIHPSEYTWKDIARIALGVALLIVGILGLIFPILNGTLFVIFSAFVLAPYSRRIRRLLDYCERRFPGIAARARQLKNRLFKTRAR